MPTPPTLPGFAAPAAGFDAPMEMLAACHDRVRRSGDRLLRIAERAAEGRIDATVRDAARDVLRYFDIAAPLHHEDEEKHVFPAVLAGCGDAALRDAVMLLQRQHVELHTLWATVRGPLQALAEGDGAAFDAAARDAAARFVALYARHASVEETLVFPAAAARLSADALEAIGGEMAQRRGVRLPASTR